MKRVISVFLILAVTFAGLAQSGLAEEKSAPNQPRKYSVKTKNYSKFSNRTAKHTAGKFSPRAIVVLYQGSDREFMEQVLAGASDAKDGSDGHDPIKVRGMVIGKVDPKFMDGADSYRIYVNGLPLGETHDASVNPRAEVRRYIIEADEDILQPLLLKLEKEKKLGNE